MQELKIPGPSRNSLVGIGLSSGTSADSIDAALVKVSEVSGEITIQLIEFHEKPYPRDISSQIKEIASGFKVEISDIVRLNYLLGELFAEAALEVIELSSLNKAQVDFIASHGQTICHLPYPEMFRGKLIRGTMQIAEPAVIAKRTGIITVADFRADDVAAGGEGAPILPYVDYLIFSSKESSRLVQNIGGIANLTYLPKNSTPDDIIAFDTGPGNMVIDEITSILSDGKSRFDKNGELAFKGNLHHPLLEDLLKNEYFYKKSPKSCGRLDFGRNFALKIVEKAKKYGLHNKDIITTVSNLTSSSIAKAYSNFLLSEGRKIDELIITGGGAFNRYIVENLKKKLPEHTKILPVKSHGLTIESREAVSFAVLAYQTLKGRKCNLPAATGAKRRVVLGKISIPD